MHFLPPHPSNSVRWYSSGHSSPLLYLPSHTALDALLIYFHFIKLIQLGVSANTTGVMAANWAPVLEPLTKQPLISAMAYSGRPVCPLSSLRTRPVLQSPLVLQVTVLTNEEGQGQCVHPKKISNSSLYFCLYKYARTNHKLVSPWKRNPFSDLSFWFMGRFPTQVSGTSKTCTKKRHLLIFSFLKTSRMNKQ